MSEVFGQVPCGKFQEEWFLCKLVFALGPHVLLLYNTNKQEVRDQKRLWVNSDFT